MSSVAAFMMRQLRRIPAEADLFDRDEYRLEVVDMDKHRIDQVLATRLVLHGTAGRNGGGL